MAFDLPLPSRRADGFFATDPRSIPEHAMNTVVDDGRKAAQTPSMPERSDLVRRIFEGIRSQLMLRDHLRSMRCSIAGGAYDEEPDPNPDHMSLYELVDYVTCLSNHNMHLAGEVRELLK